MLSPIFGWFGTTPVRIQADAAGHLQVDVLSVDDLKDALESVDTDALQVRGRDQLFSFKGPLAGATVAGISGAGGYVDSPAVPAGEIWVITNCLAVDITSATTQHEHRLRHDAADTEFHVQPQAFAAWDRSTWRGHVYLDEADVIRVTFVGALGGDTCVVSITGFRMTVET